MHRPRLGSLALLLVVTAGSVFAFRGVAPAGEPPAAPAVPLEPLTDGVDWPLSADELRGRDVYAKYCVGCHGVEGRGDGPASRFLEPLPRDFQSGKFKFRSTPFGEAPLESDLMRTVRCGLPGSSMPGFPLVSEMERRDVVRYVLHLGRLGRANRSLAYDMAEEGASLADLKRDRLAALREEIESAPVHRIVVPADVDASAASVERGRALFATSCAACHGADGRGEGASSYALRDDRGAVIRPRDFTTGVFRAGGAPEDLFLRVKGGLSGTPMPGFSDLKDEQVYDLVHFVLSIKDPAAEKPRMPPGCGHEAGDR